MAQERKKEKKSGQQATSVDDTVSWWQKFHFSGKVIMCSVLFGFGLVLIGGLLLAIGADHHDDENNGNLNEVQNKAPMSIVGPIIMGIGGFTVFVGIIMCLFETNICRKRQPDSRPLIDEQNAEASSRNSDAASIPSSSQKREKHRHHKKSSSPRKHKGVKNSEQNSYRTSPSSIPIDMHKSLSRDLTSSDKFLTPPSSLAYEHPKLQTTHSDAENQTSASLMKSYTSSGKSWNTSTEFQTPSSSLQDSSGSFGDRSNLGISPEQKELGIDRLKSLKHEFVTPKNSSAEIIDSKSSSLQGTILENSNQLHRDGNLKSKEFNEEISVKLNVLNHEFVTPMNSYVDDPNIAAPRWKISNEDSIQLSTNIEADDNAEKISKEKISANSFGSSVQNTNITGEEKTEKSGEEKQDGINEEASSPNNELIHPSNNDFESKQALSHDLKESIETPDSTSTDKNDSHTDVVS